MSCTKCGKVGHWASQCTAPPDEWVTQGRTPAASGTQVRNYCSFDWFRDFLFQQRSEVIRTCTADTAAAAGAAHHPATAEGVLQVWQEWPLVGWECCWCMLVETHAVYTCMQSIMLCTPNLSGRLPIMCIQQWVSCWQVTGLHSAKGGLGAARRQRQRRQNR